MQAAYFLAAETGEKSGLAVLGIDVRALVLQLITFLLLFVLLKKFAFSTIVRLLEERRRTIDAGVELGQEMAAQKERFDEETARLLKKARQEADNIIAAAHQEAGEIIKEAETTAARKTDTMLADAHNKIAEDLERAKKGLEQEMLVLVAQATETIIGERLDSKRDEQLIRRALQEAQERL